MVSGTRIYYTTTNSETGYNTQQEIDVHSASPVKVTSTTVILKNGDNPPEPHTFSIGTDLTYSLVEGCDCCGVFRKESTREVVAYVFPGEGGGSDSTIYSLENDNDDKFFVTISDPPLRIFRFDSGWAYVVYSTPRGKIKVRAIHFQNFGLTSQDLWQVQLAEGKNFLRFVMKDKN